MRVRHVVAPVLAAVLTLGTAVAAHAAQPLQETTGTFAAVDGPTLYEGVVSSARSVGVTLPGAATAVLSIRASGGSRGGTLEVRGAGNALTAPAIRVPAGAETVTTVFARADAAGQIRIEHRAGGDLHIAIGLQASTPSGATVPDGGYRAISPVRVARSGATGSAVSTRRIQVAGVGAIPASGIRAVVLAVSVPKTDRLGAIGALSAGQLAGDEPTDEQVPQFWYLGPATGATVVAAVRDGAAVLTDLGSGTGLAQLSADVVGYVRGEATPPGSLLTAQRQDLVDTSPGGVGGFARLASGATIRVNVPVARDPAEVTAVPFGARGVLLAVQTADAALPGTIAFAGSAATTATRSDVGYGRSPQATTVMVPLRDDRTFLVTNRGPMPVSLDITAIGALAGEADTARGAAPVRATDVGDVVVHPATGRVFVAGPTGGTVDVYEADGRLTTTIRYQAEPHGLAVRGDVLYVARAANGTVGRFDVRTLADLGDYATGLPRVVRLAWARDTLWAAGEDSADDHTPNALWRVDRQGSVQRFDGLGEDIAISPARPGTLWATDHWLLGGLNRVDISTGIPRDSSYFSVNATSLALSPDGATVYATGSDFAAVDATTGEVRATHPALGDAAAVAATPHGVLLGCTPGSVTWTARVVGPDLGAPRLTVGALPVPNGALGGTVAHGVAAGSNTLYLATTTSVGNAPAYRLASYPLPAG